MRIARFQLNAGHRLAEVKNVLITIGGNVVILIVCFLIRRTKAVLLPIIALGAWGALVASSQPTSLLRSNAPPRRLTNVTAEYNEGYRAAVELVKRSAVPLSAMYVNLVLMAVIAIGALRSKPPSSGVNR